MTPATQKQDREAIDLGGAVQDAPATGIYLHLPFCATKCNYCDFATAPFERAAAERYLEALLREIDQQDLDNRLLQADSIYFGGGTPSLVPERFIEEILNALARRFSIARGAEISLEMNPSTEESGKTAFYRTWGITRLSIGVQSFDDRELQVMTRAHTSAEAKKAVEHAAGCGFANISIDLILGLPGQTRRSFSRSLQTAVSLPLGHVSVYILELHSGTPLHGSVTAGGLRLPDEDFIAGQYRAMARYLESHGFPLYEISNFARGAFQSRHNLKYWRRLPYLGFGLSSHSFDGARRWRNTRSLKRYLQQVQATGSAREEETVINPADALRERLFLGLRLREGIAEADFDLLARDRVSLQGRWRSFVEQGWVEKVQGRYRLSLEGFLVSNAILSELV